jgi:acyl-CoA thioesterase-1
MKLQGSLVFAGDSVTDCSRSEDPDGLGFGYVRELSATSLLQQTRTVNAGVGGDRLEDLETRWKKDVLARRPDVVSVMIGINDTWRHVDSGLPSPIDTFTECYRGLLSSLPPSTGIVLLEPFVIPVDGQQETVWRHDLEPRIQAVHRLADEFGAVIVPTDRILNRLASTVGPSALAKDGVHPTARGHREIAAAWQRTLAAS